MMPRAVVSHSGKQHSPQTAYAFQEGGMLERYYTGIWFKPQHFPYRLLNGIPQGLRKEIHSYLSRRAFDRLNPSLVEQVPFYEIAIQFSKFFAPSFYTKSTYWGNRQFDKKIAKKILNQSFDAFIGYETSSLYSFTNVKLEGKTALLDLGQIHFSAHRVLEESGFDPYAGDRVLQKDVENTKDKELELADYVIVPSEYSKSTVLNAGIPMKKIRMIPYGYDDNLFRPKERYKTKGKFKILFAGSITRRKGIQYLLEAFRLLRLRNAELTLVGGMADGRDLLQNGNENVQYHPFTSPESLASLLMESDIFVLPSLMDSFGLVVLEAMACGTPVIVSENTGAKDLVRQGIDGFIVPIMDTQALQQRILELYENAEKVEVMGRNAAVRAQEYTWKLYRQRWRDELVSCCGSFRTEFKNNPEVVRTCVE